MASAFSDDVRGVRWELSDRLRHRLPDGAAFGDWLRAGEWQVVKHGPHRTVYRVRGPGLDVHLKHDRPLGMRGRVRSWLRPLKARREYELGCEIAARGIPTPIPIAWGMAGG